MKKSTLISKSILIHPGEWKPVSISHASLTFWTVINGFLITSNGQTIIFKLPSNFWPIVSDLWALWADAEAAVQLTASMAFHLQRDVAQQAIYLASPATRNFGPVTQRNPSCLRAGGKSYCWNSSKTKLYLPLSQRNNKPWLADCGI